MKGTTRDPFRETATSGFEKRRGEETNGSADLYFYQTFVPSGKFERVRYLRISNSNSGERETWETFLIRYLLRV